VIRRDIGKNTYVGEDTDVHKTTLRIMKPGSVDHGIWRESTHGNPTFDITTIAIRHRSDSEFKDYRALRLA
jgi:hypothetical protein